MLAETIAGYGGIVFSVLIGIAVLVSLDKRFYEAKLEPLFWAVECLALIKRGCSQVRMKE